MSQWHLVAIANSNSGELPAAIKDAEIVSQTAIDYHLCSETNVLQLRDKSRAGGLSTAMAST